MQLVSVDKDFFAKCKKYGTDRELLYDKQGRPCVLIVDLVYKGQKHTFVVPLRSNIAKNVPKSQYFPLPPQMHLRSREKDTECIILNCFRWIKNMCIHIKYRRVHIW